MAPKLVLAISTLVLGTALTAIPAFAQQRAGPAAGNAPATGNEQERCSAYFQTSCSDKPYPMPGSTAASPSNRAQGAARTAPAPRGRVQAQGEDRRFYDYAGPNFGGPMQPPAAVQACAARFRSYDPATGTFMGFDGIRHPCP